MQERLDHVCGSRGLIDLGGELRREQQSDQPGRLLARPAPVVDQPRPHRRLRPLGPTAPGVGGEEDQALDALRSSRGESLGGESAHDQPATVDALDIERVDLDRLLLLPGAPCPGVSTRARRAYSARWTAARPAAGPRGWRDALRFATATPRSE